MDPVITKNLNIKGKAVLGIEVKFPNAKLVAVLSEKGYLMCGYLNIETAEKFRDAACIVTGVNTVEEILAAKVVKLTSCAAKLGVKEGMSGKDALEFLI